jgi:aryl-alcohol dehydrogenase-like predicted oxidoreductase
MQTRPFGRTGLEVPVLGFGAMQLGDPSIDEATAARVLHHVLDQGLALIDTARSYGLAEERIGRHLESRRGEFVLSTKVGYDIAGTRDWTHDCVLRGVDAARDRLRVDVIDIVHLHSCSLEVLQAGDVTRALQRCVDDGKVRVAAYSGDDAPLRYAVDSAGAPPSVTSPASAGEVARSAGERRFYAPAMAAGAAAVASLPSPNPSALERADAHVFRSVQASVNLCDQQALPVLQRAHERGLGTIAKRSLAGRPWVGTYYGDCAHDEYRRRFEALRSHLPSHVDDWDAFALRFAAHAPGVVCVIVGGTSVANVDRNVAAVRRGPLAPSDLATIAAAFESHGGAWQGLI